MAISFFSCLSDLKFCMISIHTPIIVINYFGTGMPASRLPIYKSRLGLSAVSPSSIHHVTVSTCDNILAEAPYSTPTLATSTGLFYNTSYSTQLFIYNRWDSYGRCKSRNSSCWGITDLARNNFYLKFPFIFLRE